MLEARRLQLKLVGLLALMLALCALMAAFALQHLLLTWAIRDVGIRAQLTASFVESTLDNLDSAEGRGRIEKLLEQLTHDERLFALAICGAEPQPIVRTALLPPAVTCVPRTESPGSLAEAADLNVVRVPLVGVGEPHTLIVLHDLSYAHLRTTLTIVYLGGFMLLVLIAVSIVVLLIARSTVRGWAEQVGAVLRGGPPPAPGRFAGDSSMMRDFNALLHEMYSYRAASGTGMVRWTEETLKTLLKRKLYGDQVLVVSNREPYVHTRRAGKIAIDMPAGGLVTALEPILKASEGTWIAHGSGEADWEVVDEHDRVKVPPPDPCYHLRRVRLSQEEVQGYYSGFSNEGLWPLCHIAHTRPVFREPDWETYRRVNEKFASVVIDEARSRDPIVLVQDFHFSLLPRLLAERLPNATAITFWHVPWPTPEVFGICPWRKEILEGLLGSTIIGFHTRAHCGTFLRTVARFIEAQIDFDRSTITYQGRITSVQPYPISIAWPEEGPFDARRWAQNRKNVTDRTGLPEDAVIAVGVDRLDYIKGITEKLRAVERLLELHAEWRGRFALLQIAAPSRSTLPEYLAHAESVRAMARHINERFGGRGAPPVTLLESQYSHDEVLEFLRAADICVITSLHDGMNLVAKEFVAARSNEAGVLVLSQFAGASRSLPEALVVNPYNVDDCARALQRALVMPQEEQSLRMQRMRGRVREQNIYWWAGRMLIDAAEVREEQRLESRLKELHRAA